MGATKSAWTVLLALVLSPACDGTPPPSHDDRPQRPVRIPEPIAAALPGAPADLLQGYLHRDPIDPREADLWELPFQSKRLAVALLIIAGKDRLEDLDLVLTPDATWGLPEPRRFGARPIFDGDGGEAFLAAFRSAAARFPEKAQWQAPALPIGGQELVRSGAEPMWSFYTHENDRILLRMVVQGGRARIDYVGLFETVPTEPVRVVGHGRSMSLGAQIRRAPSDGSEAPLAAPDPAVLEAMRRERERLAAPATP